MILEYAPKDLHLKTVKWDGTNFDEIKQFTFNSVGLGYIGNPDGLRLITLDGEQKIRLNDYIIKDANGRFYGVIKEIFEKYYEARRLHERRDI